MYIVKYIIYNLLLYYHAVVESYELTGRHTYPSMAVTAGGSVVILICLVVLYKSLAPISNRTERDLVVDATSKLPTMEQDFPGVVYVCATCISL